MDLEEGVWQTSGASSVGRITGSLSRYSGFTGGGWGGEELIRINEAKGSLKKKSKKLRKQMENLMI
jgi:hypothetical protein